MKDKIVWPNNNRCRKKASDNTQHAYLIKTLNKLSRDGIYINIFKVHIYKPRANITFNGKKLKASLQRLGTSGYPRFPLLLNILLGALPTDIKQEKDRKSIQIRKELKLFLFAGNMTSYIENHFTYTHILTYTCIHKHNGFLVNYT